MQSSSLFVYIIRYNPPSRSIVVRAGVGLARYGVWAGFRAMALAPGSQSPDGCQGAESASTRCDDALFG